jgi:hypothetical protein
MFTLKNLFTKKENALPEWKHHERTIFRISFVYFLFLCLPLDFETYKYLYKIDWSDLNCRDLFVLATWRHFDFVKFTNESGIWGIVSYVNLVIPLLFAIPLGYLWNYFYKKELKYDLLYYWIRTIVRYRVGLGLIAWGFRKLIPGQMVLPTLGILNTPMGDFQAQKLYWQGVGIVPEYEVFLGLAEFAAGFLLLFRKTTTLGAALSVVVMANIVIANHVYDGSVHVHSFYYTLLSLFILWKDFPKIWHLLIHEKDVVLTSYYPSFSETWQKYSRLGIKIFIHIVFVGLFLGLQIEDWIHDPYRLPDTPGLKGIQGYYEVHEFRLNNKILPYSPLDSVRWHNVVFERWSTLSFKTNRSSMMDQSNGGGYSKEDLERSWELAGIGGGRRYFYYQADTVKQIITLQNKNKAHRKEKQILHYYRPDSTRVILAGTNENNDSIYVVLDKVSKDYPVMKKRYEAVVSIP